MIKKLLALALSLVLAFSFVGCSPEKDADKKDETTKTEEKATKEETKTAEEPVKVDEKAEATEAAEDFMDALVDFDYDELQGLVTDPDAIPEEISYLDVDVLMEEIGAEEAFAGYEDDFKKIFQTMIDNMKAECTYELEEVKEDGDNYIASGVIIMPNFDSFDFDSYFEEALSEDKMMEVMMEMYENGEITDDMSEEEMLDAIFPVIIDYCEEVINDIDFSKEVKEEEFKIDVIKSGDKWLVDSSTL